MPPFFKMFLLGIFLVVVGYLILFNVPGEASPERIMLQAMAGMGLSITGALFIMLWILKKSKL